MIRPAFPNEADAVRALVREAYERWIARLGRDPSPMQDDYAQRIADGEAWVLEREAKLMGLIVLRDGADALLIPNIAVVPAAQGQGYGRWLIAFAEAEARRRGHREVKLVVNALLVENVAIYQHLGFGEVERIHGQGPDRAYIVMAKSVSL